MTELVNQQKELLISVREGNIPAEITESYPAYFGFRAGFLIPVKVQIKNTLSIGGQIEHSSTGGRIHYQDYSGEMRADQTVKETSIGLVLNYQSHYKKEFELGFNFSVNYMFSSMSNLLYLKLGDASQSQNPKFNSSSIGIEPGIIPSFLIWKLRLGVSLSYLIYFPSSLEYDEMSNAFLINNNGDKVNINWSGFRLGLLTSISL